MADKKKSRKARPAAKPAEPTADTYVPETEKDERWWVFVRENGVGLALGVFENKPSESRDEQNLRISGIEGEPIIHLDLRNVTYVYIGQHDHSIAVPGTVNLKPQEGSTA